MRVMPLGQAEAVVRHYMRGQGRSPTQVKCFVRAFTRLNGGVCAGFFHSAPFCARYDVLWKPYLAVRSEHRFCHHPRLSAAGTIRPHRLRGVPLHRGTHLRLFVSSAPPFVLDIDSGRITRIKGINVRGNPIVSVAPVGQGAIVLVDRRGPSSKAFPNSELYLVRHGQLQATRIGSGWEVAPTTNGGAIWVKRYRDLHHCLLDELGFDGKIRQSRGLPCWAEVLDAGGATVLVEGSKVADPQTGRTLLRMRGLWAIIRGQALVDGGTHRPLALVDLRSGKRRSLPWPSRINGLDQAAVQPGGVQAVLGFSDPSYQGTGDQVTDLWLLDARAKRLRHLPGMPVYVPLKFTSIVYTRDGRLVMLTVASRVVGYRVVTSKAVVVWRQGRKQLGLKRVKLPNVNAGSDSFVLWSN
jgi:hypothetical protein